MLANFRRARNLSRYYKIVAVLARHGFGSILEYLRVDHYFPFVNPAVFKKSVHPSHLTPAEHLRLALEELGPTFVKLGQIFSTRPDIFPPQFIVELSKLQDGVPPAEWELIHNTLRVEYHCDLAKIFKWIDPIPLGSASLAQVHAAELIDGSQVAVKIQRPNIIRNIQSDLDILTDLAGLAQRTPWGELYDPVEIVTHFAFTLMNELDYRLEAANAEKFRQSFTKEKHLYIPSVYWEYTTQRVLVLEKLEGIKIDQTERLEQAGIDRQKVAEYAATVIIKEIVEDGFFHADPHPGNFVVIPDRVLEDGSVVDVTVGAMDFGMVGHVSKSDRANLLQAYSLAAKKDTKGIVELIQRIGAVSGQVDSNAIERDIDRILSQYHGLPLHLVQTRRVMEEMMQVAYHYRIVLPADMWLLFKTLMMMDGLARRLDPKFNVFGVFTPHIDRLVLEMRMPWVWGPTMMQDLEGLLLASRDLPSIGENLLRELQKGKLPFSFNIGANKETLDRLDQMSTRFSLSILVAAFILGLALLLPVSSGSRIATILVGIGFLAALSLGIWVVFSILWHR